MQSKPVWRRRTQYVIARNFQLRFSILLVGVGLATTFAVGFILYAVLAKTEAVLVGTGVVTSPQVIDFVTEQRSLFIYAVVGIFIGVTSILMVLGIFISHRLAGPIFAISRKMTQLAHGDFNAKVFLRKGDEFHDLKDRFNTLVQALHNQVKSELLKIDETIKTLEKLLAEKQVSPEAEVDVKSTLRELKAYYVYKRNLIEPSSDATFIPAETADEEELI